MKIFFLACVLVLLADRFTSNEGGESGGSGGAEKQCNKSLVESYNLTSYAKPREMNMYICPNIRSSCCSIYDQFMMFTHWRDVISVKLKKYYKAINDKISNTKKLVEEIFKLDLERKIEHMKASDKVKQTITQKWDFLKTKNIEVLLDKLLAIQVSTASFLTRFRSAFYCTICDFKNHAYFDVESKIIQIEEATCGELAEETINLSYMINIIIAPLLMDLTEITGNFSHSGIEPPVSIKKFDDIQKHVRKCGLAYKDGNGSGKICEHYCAFYNFNANSPVIEGYQIFFNDVMNALSKFLKENGDASNERRLASLIYTTEKMTKGRLLTTIFSKEQLRHIKDPYEDHETDPDYNEYTLNEMFNFESGYENDRHEAYANFVKNKLHYFDVEPDMEKPSEAGIFKTSSHKVMDLENYQTKNAEIGGVDIVGHSDTTNINESMKELIAHLKLKTKYKIYYEKLDPTLLAQVNDITNDMVRDYHRDNFLDFQDFAPELKKGEMMANLDNIVKTSKKQGYDLGKKKK